MTRSEWLIIKTLQKDTSIIILLADKGNAKVMMDNFKYSDKLANRLGVGSYAKVKKNPTPPKKQEEAVTDPLWE